ncbi:MAG: NADH-quinone oxidoreductase subunit L [Planctomycetota bacterium]|nr:MAG: NADH-quinone oxidoreductase subunit L [Planctomycetota bacterium]REJ96441.1 MAG: NADH-quinone oxidoreductase subunit L [Planctomycetota bacterium]REK29808.1 MAG: NADH-quinone oxidoreductase subunit L [Planctomycetota bacterium]REK30565.1 MAG: NADH-quinone oxidoreductase subunit L [Planctomycetota bacterium]
MSVEQYLETAESLKWLLTVAWLLPLLGFAVEIFGGYWGDRHNKVASYLAVGCIGTGFVCSLIALFTWGGATHWGHPEEAVAAAEHDHAHDEGHAHDDAHAHNDGHEHDEEHAHAEEHGPEHDDEHAHHVNDPYSAAFSGSYYMLGQFGDLTVSLDYYIDGLTIVMFCMVTLIATCIHVFAIGYMSDELTDDYEDHFVHLPGGKHFHRPGRFYRFFAYLSLFSFSMLGLVIAGNIFMVFVFWELVGVCSYLLIGFYVERKSASTAANKAFIMNRVGDFGFLIGLMILFTSFGTFRFANPHPTERAVEPGLFQMLRGEHGDLHIHGEGREAEVFLTTATGDHDKSIPYWLLVTAGLGIFAGCIGKSAQFPLQTWLPDAMEGPTPVSALVHSATMVAAGVYLAGRFYPMFTPEVLLVIAYVGCITLFIGATIAIVATDIKRVLAYSTISQLGYMMLALGVGGWVAGLFHLITHAFFKSLMFLCSGSVIHGCHHEQEMTRMGGLRKKMPITAYTMLVGVIAISGLAIPYLTFPFIGNIAFSGFYSKDEIVATALTHMSLNPVHFLLFLVPLVTAGITAFYMFRLWFMTFAGEPKDEHVYDHAHESPWVMTAPLLVLSFFAITVTWGMQIDEEGHLKPGYLVNALLTAEPAHVGEGLTEAGILGLSLPGHHAVHEYHATAGTAALIAAFAGLLISYLIYVNRAIDPAGIARQLSGTYNFLVEKWQFDNLYDAMFVRPVHIVARWPQAFDRNYLDGFLHALCRCAVWVSKWDRAFDERVVDRLVNLVGDVTFAVGRSLTVIQTGRLRQYVMFIAVGVVALFALMFVFMPTL